MKIWILLFIILAVIYDYRDFQIPNWLNGIGACITLILAGICGMKVMDITAGVLIVFASCGFIILYWMPWRWRRETAYGMRNFYRVGNAPVSNFIIYM